MSRIYIELTLKIEGNIFTDTEAVIGYDEDLETWFLQAFEQYDEETDTEEPQIWLGSSFKEYENINDLITQLYEHNISFDFINPEERDIFSQECIKLNQPCKYLF